MVDPDARDEGVLRGDESPIVVGEGSNVQDNAVVHSDLGAGVEIGRWVSIGSAIHVQIGCEPRVSVDDKYGL